MIAHDFLLETNTELELSYGGHREDLDMLEESSQDGADEHQQVPAPHQRGIGSLEGRNLVFKFAKNKLRTPPNILE